MKRILNIVLKNMGQLSISAVSLSANTTSLWLSHQPDIPNNIGKFKKINSK